jgi:hypothetical protein
MQIHRVADDRLVPKAIDVEDNAFMSDHFSLQKLYDHVKVHDCIQIACLPVQVALINLVLDHSQVDQTCQVPQCVSM